MVFITGAASERTCCLTRCCRSRTVDLYTCQVLSSDTANSVSVKSDTKIVRKRASSKQFVRSWIQHHAVCPSCTFASLQTFPFHFPPHLPFPPVPSRPCRYTTSIVSGIDRVQRLRAHVVRSILPFPCLPFPSFPSFSLYTSWPFPFSSSLSFFLLFSLTPCPPLSDLSNVS